jgi:hypothetical protein
LLSFDSMEPIQDEQEALEPVSIVRNETVLSRYPIHRLAKKGSLSIQYTKTSDKGKVITTWEVAPNRKYGEPGPLAYKLDTLFINRIIDELRPNIPEIIKLGSLRQIAEELGFGNDTPNIKKALLQNAFAGITAKLNYKGNDGTERAFEFGATRYDVIFVGQKLPDGQKADSVYIILHRLYRELLKAAPIRPLDYDYLKELPPAAQRFYELVSFQIFGALKNDNKRAKYLYSDFCAFAPLTRYDDYDRMKKQMYKLHAPHRESGYITKVEFEETTDGEGRPDWVMLYTPGPKARAEFRAFTKKKMPLLVAAGGVGQGERPAPKRKPKPADPLPAEDAALVEKLRHHHVAEGTARELVRDYRAAVEAQLDAFPHRDRSGIRDTSAWLIRAIREGYELPAGLAEVKAKAEEVKRARAKKALEEARHSHEERHRAAFEEYLATELARFQEASQEAYTAFNSDFEKRVGRILRSLSPENREGVRLAHFADWAKGKAGLSVLTFWQWDAERNPEPFRTDG